MNIKFAAGAAVVIGVVAAYFWREAPAPTDGNGSRAPSAGQATGGGSGRGVQAAIPGAGIVRPVAPGGSGLPQPRPTLSNEFANARQLKALYDRLANSTEGKTPEGLYTLYRIMRACANVTDRRGPRPLRVPTDEERRTYVDALAERDPSRAKRIAAYEQLSEDRCVGLTGMVMTEADLSAKLREALSEG